nr:retrovirus-related Pol polyprotein from transposon TNT 1-94 [Tanacetum cinerariifolium]
MDFMSSSNNNSTNRPVNIAQAVNTSLGVSTSSTQVNAANADKLSDVVICAFMASQPSSHQLVNKDLEQTHPDDFEEMDLKWQMAMLTIRARMFLKKTGRKLTVNEIDEFANKHVVENIKAESSQEKPKEVRKNTDTLIIKEWVSDDEDEEGNPQMDLQDKRVINSGCSRNMTGNMSYLTYYEEIDGGYVAFRGNPKRGKITSKGTKDKTSGIIKSFITRIENLVDHKVKVIRCDNRTEFKNREMNQFYEMKGILRQYSVARTHQHNRVAKRKNMTLIEAARTTLADYKLPTTFRAEAVNTACYVQNRLLVVKPHNKNIYELFHGRTLALSFMRPCGCPITILNTVDHLGKYNGIQSNGFAGTKACDNADPKSSQDDGFQPSSDNGKKVNEDPSKVSKCRDQKQDDNVNSTNNVNAASTNEVNVVSENIRHTQEERIDYDEVFSPVARIEAIRLFLAYASFKDFMVYQMDIKSTFLYRRIKEEVYICQPPGFEDPNFPNKVGKIDKTLFIRRHKGDNLLVQVCVDDIIFRSTKKELCIAFEKMMHEKFQMSSMEELTFFLGLQVKQKQDGIFICQDKYFTKMVKQYVFSEVKNASTPMETQKPPLKEEDGEEVDVHMYRSMIGSLMYLTSSRPDIMFTVCACARYQVNKNVLHIHDVKRIFRYLKGQPKFGLWYPKDCPFDLVAYTDSDYAGALDKKSTTGGCQFLGCRLISWQCKK